MTIREDIETVDEMIEQMEVPRWWFLGLCAAYTYCTDRLLFSSRSRLARLIRAHKPKNAWLLGWWWPLEDNRNGKGGREVRLKVLRSVRRELQAQLLVPSKARTKAKATKRRKAK